MASLYALSFGNRMNKVLDRNLREQRIGADITPK